MSENTKIEWADHTFNPWIGCTKVGPGCDNCYAKADFEDRRHRVVWGAGQARSRTKTWGDPVRWNNQHEAFFAQHGRRQRVFCASLADVFDNAVPDDWRDDLLKLIRATPNLDWLLLTKRIGNAREYLAKWPSMPWPNVWIGATIVNQEEADRDIPKLLAVPAAKRFLSMEPLLGPVDILKWLDPWTCADCSFHGSENDCGPDGCEKCGEQDAFGTEDVCKSCGADDQAAKPSCPLCRSHRSFERDYGFKFDSEKKLIDWVIVGGESGPNARPMHPDWARSLRDQCQAAGVPFLFKQFGEWGPTWFEAHNYLGPLAPLDPSGVSAIAGTRLIVGRYEDGRAYEDIWPVIKAGKKAAGRLLDGITHDGVPT